MWSSSKGEKNTEARRKELLEKGFELFSTKSIEAISMRNVAEAVGCGSVSAAVPGEEYKTQTKGEF